MSTFSAEEKRRFMRDGFLVLENGVDKELCARARDVLWDVIPEDRDDPDSWFDRDGDHDEILHRESSSDSDVRFDDVTPFEKIFRVAYDYAEQLVGPEKLAPPEQRPTEYCLHGGHLMASREDGEPAVDHDGAVGPILQYPSDIDGDAQSSFDYRSGWHVDGGTGPYATNDDAEYLPFTVACAVYFDEVVPRGGGFTVWPGSHRLTEKYFEDHTYGDYVADSGVLEDLEPGPGFEITGSPGTLVLWHHNIIHGPAPNHSGRVRMAGFQRFAHQNIAQVGQSGLADIWQMYPALQDLVETDSYVV